MRHWCCWRPSTRCAALVGDEPLEARDFFHPPIDSIPLPDSEGTAAAPADIRRAYQHALRGFLVDNENREALQTLQAIALKIRDQAEFSDTLRRTGWAAAGMVSALLSDRTESGPDSARLFARLDVVLKQAAEGQSSDETAEPLCRHFLFQVASAGPADDLAGVVYEAFELDKHRVDQGDQTRVFLAGHNRALFAAVTQAAREDLAQIKDTLGSQLEGSIAPDVLEQQTTLLESVGESLSMLGLEKLARRIREQASRLGDLSADPDDPALLTVARELLVVESQLEDSFALAAFEDSDESEDETGATLLPPSEQKRVLRQLLAEALEDLTHAKSLLDALNRGKADSDAAGEAHEALDRIGNALYMADREEGALLIHAARRLVQDTFIDNVGEAPEQSRLETLAEALTIAELYLESMSELDSQGRKHFATAQQNLEALGYWPGQVADEPESPDPAQASAIVREESEPAEESLETFAGEQDEPDQSVPRHRRNRTLWKRKNRLRRNRKPTSAAASTISTSSRSSSRNSTRNSNPLKKCSASGATRPTITKPRSRFGVRSTRSRAPAEWPVPAKLASLPGSSKTS
jgi:chemosensory pili system protein ChpA (sensor histidine kinase/response regulator)